MAQTTAQPARLGPNPRPTTTGPSEKNEKEKEKENFTLGTLNLFLKPFKPFHYFFVSGIFASGPMILVSNSSFDSFSFFGRGDGFPDGGGR